MGHIRLGRLPESKRWDQVLAHLRAGDSIGDLAAATAHAAESELLSAKGDPALGYTVWLLTQLPLAARSKQFRDRLAELGFDAGAEQSVLALVAGFSLAVDRNIADRGDRTDLGELARQAAAESLSTFVGSETQSLFGTSADDVQRELGRLATKDRFAQLARDFFARLTLKVLEYYISRELPNHVGPGKGLQTIDDQIEFRAALERHCREAALIVEAFAGGWYSKRNYQGALTPVTTQAFTDYALKKLRDELRKRRTSNA
jgi:hypothetical protein